MIPDHAMRALIADGYLLLGCYGPYVSAIRRIADRDRYIVLVYDAGRFSVLSQ